MQQGIRVLLRILLVTFALVLTGLTSATQAQDTNLLRDGGFEGTFTSRGRADLNIPSDWSIWVADTPHTEDWMNLPVVGYPHNGPDPVPHGGAHSLNLNKGYATFTAAVYQQVSVPDGANVSASAWAFIRTCKIDTGQTQCTSTPDSNAFTRIGIDPNGGTNPFDSDVVWSANAAPHETWQQMNVSATATGATVTLFLYATQQWPMQLNNAYWDDASLSVGGSGGVAAAQPGAATPAPTSAAAAPFVNAQGERADGSVVHTVEAGDTLDSIAFAYGVTRADLLALNNIADPRIIQIGQQIIVKAAPKPTEEATPEVTEAAAAGTDESSPATPAASPTVAQPDEVRYAPPAPVVSVGTAVYPIDPAANTASICVIFFEDSNNNRIQDMGESTLPGGDILLTSNGAPAGQHTSDNQPDPFCFDQLAAGSFSVQASAPEGYGLTTPDQLKVQAYPGAQINVAFGAAQGVEAVVPPPADSNGSVSATSGSDTDTHSSGANGLSSNLGLIVFGAAGLVLVVGMSVSVILRRR